MKHTTIDIREVDKGCRWPVLILPVYLQFSQNDSTDSVAWQLIGSDGNIVDRNSSSLVSLFLCLLLCF